MSGALLRSNKSGCGPFHLAGNSFWFRLFSSSGISEVQNEQEAALIQSTASKVCETIRRRPRWEGFLLSLFNPSSSGILHPTCISLVICRLSDSNPLLALRYYLWLTSSFSDFTIDPPAAASLLSALARSRAWRAAFHAIRSTKILADISIFNSFVVQLCSDIRSIHRDKNLLDNLCHVLEGHFHPTSCLHTSLSLVSWNSTLSASLKAERIDLFQRFYAMMIESGTAPDAPTAGYLIRAFCRECRPMEAYHVLRDLSRNGIIPDVVSLTELVASFAKVGNFGKVSEILHLMIAGGCSPDLFTYQGVIHGLCNVASGETMVDEGFRIFCEIKVRGYAPDVVTYTTMIDGLCKSGRMDDACLLWSEMIAKGMQPNSYTYNAIINGYCKSGDLEKAQKLYDEMLSKGLEESTVSCNTMIAGMCMKGMLAEAIKLFDTMPKKGIEHDLITFNTLIQGLCKVSRTSDAIELYLRMAALGIRPSVSTYTPLIQVLCEEGQVTDAMELLKLMEAEGLEPLVCTNDCIIKGFCRIGKAEEGMAWLSKMLHSNLKPRSETVNKLVECLSSLGLVDDALQVVNIMFGIGYSLGSSVCHLIISKLCGNASYQTGHVLNEIILMET
ncbi:hypothetical protein HPP92_020320 [Vanilla planifolia]|uniref:Pentatricopeptide repeat-containing protein n=1 Tax=Vanilla planifolia TaxID=51239 RepID=A0A835UG63_VANPL|nr:hypothetical protein HPP92_020320 [Vanilla planifolia]